jgi:hypothetical protein
MVTYPVESEFWTMSRTGRTVHDCPNVILPVRMPTWWAVWNFQRHGPVTAYSCRQVRTPGPPAWFPRGLVQWPAVQVRFPRSKKRRIVKKWARKPSSWLEVRPLIVPAAGDAGSLMIEASDDGLSFSATRI